MRMGITCILGSAAVGGVTGAINGAVGTALEIGPNCPMGYQWGLELGEEAATRVQGIPITAPREISKNVAGGVCVGTALGALAGVAATEDTVGL